MAGEAVRIPSFGSLERSEVAFLAESSAGYTADAFDKLNLEKGFLVATGLEAGEWVVVSGVHQLREGASVRRLER